jgi:hypothetical protein
MEAKPRVMMKEEDYTEVLRLLGFAQFNLAKDNIEETQILIDKAIVALGGKGFYDED